MFPNKIKKDSVKKIKCELWTNINQTQLETLLDCFQKDEKFVNFIRLLEQQLGLDSSKVKERIIIEKYFYLLRFGIEENFSRIQLGILFSLFDRLHKAVCETIFGNLDETYNYINKLILAYSVHRPPHYIQIFTPIQANKVLQYLSSSYFKCFGAIKYAFTSEVYLQVKLEYKGLLTPLTPSNMRIEVKNDYGSIPEICFETKKEEESDERTYELRQIILSYLRSRLDKMRNQFSIQESNNKVNQRNLQKTKHK